MWFFFSVVYRFEKIDFLSENEIENRVCKENDINLLSNHIKLQQLKGLSNRPDSNPFSSPSLTIRLHSDLSEALLVVE